MTADRQKHLLVRDQHPELDIRFVFSRSAAKINKASKPPPPVPATPPDPG